MIKAMHESGIPIDYIGGNSIGSLMGAIWADELDVTRARQRAREWAMVRERGGREREGIREGERERER